MRPAKYGNTCIYVARSDGAVLRCMSKYIEEKRKEPKSIMPSRTSQIGDKRLGHQASSDW